MKLNQLSLAVDDVPAASQVLERYFGLSPSGEGHKNFAMLHDDDGMTLALMGAGAEAVSAATSAGSLTAARRPRLLEALLSSLTVGS